MSFDSTLKIVCSDGGLPCFFESPDSGPSPNFDEKNLDFPDLGG